MKIWSDVLIVEVLKVNSIDVLLPQNENVLSDEASPILRDLKIDNFLQFSCSGTAVPTSTWPFESGTINPMHLFSTNRQEMLWFFHIYDFND